MDWIDGISWILRWVLGALLESERKWFVGRENHAGGHTFKRCWPRKAERVSAGVPSALGTKNGKGLDEWLG